MFSCPHVGCKASLVFLQYFIMENFYWLLVEGLYLHMLLLVMFSENRPFVLYLLVSCGRPWGEVSSVGQASCPFPVQVFPPCSCSPG